MDDTPTSLQDAINRFLAAETWDESQRIVEAHPELLGDEADERFALALAEYAGDPDAVQMLTTHRDLLRRCREAGIARAFAEQMLGADGLAEAERLGVSPEEFLAQMRAAAADAARAARGAGRRWPPKGVDLDSPDALERALAERPDLEAAMLHAAMEQMPPALREVLADAGRRRGGDRQPGGVGAGAGRPPRAARKAGAGLRPHRGRPCHGGSRRRCSRSSPNWSA